MCSKARLNKIVDEVSRDVRDALGDRLKSVILYGSYARGDFDDESDIDFMVLADNAGEKMPEFRNALCGISSDISLENNVTVSILLKDGKFFYDHARVLPFYQNVVSEGVTVYER